MSCRLLPTLLLALGVAGPLASAATAQDLVILAFGDSITEGFGDTSNPGGGYPRRLERWLDQQGYDTVVESHGVGGETTSSGLSRIDSVLAGGGDYLLLMEGTNDISRRSGIETIAFNLREMAERAEALDIIVVHGTVIPRIPTAPVDSDNSATSALAQAIRTMGEEFHRAVADQFTLFEGLPNVFENYYYYNPDVVDPVGHPNTAGYIEMAGLFFETLLPLLDTTAIEIVPPPQPVRPGQLVPFGIDGVALEEFVHIEWDFGEGGYVLTSPPDGLTVYYLFLHPGTFTVTVRGSTAEGAVAEDSVVVVVTGAEPGWETDTALLPVVVESNDGQIVTNLVLVNSSLDFAVAEVTFLPEISYDEPPPVLRFVLPVQSTTTLYECLSTTFGVGTGRGALSVTFYALPQSSTSFLSARAVVHSASDPDGSEGATVNGIREENWNAAAKQIVAIPHSASSPATLVVANPDGAAGSIRFDLLDGVGGYVGSGVLEVGAGSSRLRALADLFRNLAVRPAPFKAIFGAANIRYTAVALIAEPSSGEIVVLLGTP